MTYIEKQLKELGMKEQRLVLDMQLYKLAMQVKWSDKDRWMHFHPEPGGMHALQSFIGCLGTLMAGSGIVELCSPTFKGNPNMMNGKSWPKSVRFFRMISSIIIQSIIQPEHLYPDKINEARIDVENALQQAEKSRTGKLWVDCVTVQIGIMRCTRTHSGSH